jgi:N-acetylneuraminate lyase
LNSRFSGIWPAMLSPIGPDGRPCLKTVARLVELFVEQGLGGVYVTGSTGQWPLLTLDERRAIAETAVRTAAGRLPVMVHIGATATEDAVALAHHAAAIGADAVSAIGPTYYSHSAETVLEHYRRVCRATRLPFYVYHLMGVSQDLEDPAVYVERLLSLPNIAGMKYTERDLYPLGVIRACAGERLNLMSGADELLCQAVLCGADGAIGTFYNLWGAECRAAREACAGGDVAAARDFMLRFQLALSRILSAGGEWSFLRAAMLRRHGIDVGMPRAPLGVTDRHWTAAEVDELLALVQHP